MRERSNRAVSKTVVPQGTGGSNPPLSVFCKRRILFSCIACFICFGEMSEWSKVHDWKSCVPEMVPRVRIPLSPSRELCKRGFSNPVRSGRKQRQINSFCAVVFPGFFVRRNERAKSRSLAADFKNAYNAPLWTIHNLMKEVFKRLRLRKRISCR